MSDVEILMKPQVQSLIEYWPCCREVGDQMRAISYINAFAGSHLPSQIIKWVTSQIGLEENANRSNGSSPKALISE
jgi:hypothetical protein